MQGVPLVTILASIPTWKAGTLAGVAAVIAAAIGGGAYLAASEGIPWWIYAAAVGVVIGLLIGMVVLVNVPRSAQLIGLGAILGIGADATANAITPDGVGNVVSSLAKLVAAVAVSVQGATETTGVPHPAELPLSVGIWVCILAIALMMLLGMLVTGGNTPASPPGGPGSP